MSIFSYCRTISLPFTIDNNYTTIIMINWIRRSTSIGVSIFEISNFLNSSNREFSIYNINFTNIHIYYYSNSSKILLPIGGISTSKLSAIVAPILANVSNTSNLLGLKKSRLYIITGTFSLV